MEEREELEEGEDNVTAQTVKDSANQWPNRLGNATRCLAVTLWEDQQLLKMLKNVPEKRNQVSEGLHKWRRQRTRSWFIIER